MLAKLGARGFDWRVYVCPFTQKKKRVWIAKEPKAKTSSVPKPPSEKRTRRRPRRDVDAEIAGEKVEMRKVPRASVEAEIDGFGSVRERMEAKKVDNAKHAEAKKKRGKKKGK